jgi:hypothetical protein
LDTLSERFYIQARKELVLQRGTSIQEEKLGGRTSIEVDLPALPGTPTERRHLHEASAVIPFFRNLWREFGKDCRLERSSTIIIDRRTGSLRQIFRVGKPPRREGDQILHSVEFCVLPSEGGENHLNVHETVLGAVHTHPKGSPPSRPDSDLVRAMEGLAPKGGGSAPTELEQHIKQRICGYELYTMLRDARGNVSVIRVGIEPEASEVLGPILGDFKECD